ncbi:hypothetical protein MRX96_014383 [Rhipicephalus microplus]
MAVYRLKVAPALPRSRSLAVCVRLGVDDRGSVTVVLARPWWSLPPSSALPVYARDARRGGGLRRRPRPSNAAGNGRRHAAERR